jgi:uncharacterized Zn finger protein (UPF0148 family)
MGKAEISIPSTGPKARKAARKLGISPSQCRVERLPSGRHITVCRVSRHQLKGYEEAPATKLLATHCAVCSRPLVDAKSVETGIGPICAAKHGMNQSCDPEARAEANKLVYQIARYQTGPKAEEAALRLRELGFEVLSKKVMKRLKVKRSQNIRITDAGNEYHVYLPWYGRDYVEAFKREMPRRWFLGDKKEWAIPKTAKRDLWKFLQKHNAGQLIVGPKGPFTV